MARVKEYDTKSVVDSQRDWKATTKRVHVHNRIFDAPLSRISVMLHANTFARYLSCGSIIGGWNKYANMSAEAYLLRAIQIFSNIPPTFFTLPVLFFYLLKHLLRNLIYLYTLENAEYKKQYFLSISNCPLKNIPFVKTNLSISTSLQRYFTSSHEYTSSTENLFRRNTTVDTMATGPSILAFSATLQSR